MKTPFLWKLWLLPFSLFFVGALDALLRRFAKGVVAPVLWMTVLSPTFLPSLNLMLDIPALALSLAAIAVFFRAFHRGSIAAGRARRAAGRVGDGDEVHRLPAPAVALLYTIIFWGRPFAANFRRRAAPASSPFCWPPVCFSAGRRSSPTFTANRTFFATCGRTTTPGKPRSTCCCRCSLSLAVSSPPIILLSLAGLRVPRPIVALVGAMAIGYGLIVALPLSTKSMVAVEDLVFAGLGILTLATAAAVMGQLWFDRPQPEIVDPESDNVPLTPKANRSSVFAAMDVFLVLWSWW